MADTRRTLAALQTLLADNTSGAISPQDLRDMLLTLVPPFGGESLESNAAVTTISVVSTPVVTNWNAAGVGTGLREFTASTGGRLTYTGIPDTHAMITASLSAFVTINASKRLNFYLYKNGTTQIGSHQGLTTQGSSDYEATAIVGDVALATNDYVELWCSNETDTNDITLEDAEISIHGMIL